MVTAYPSHATCSREEETMRRTTQSISRDLLPGGLGAVHSRLWWLLWRCLLFLDLSWWPQSLLQLLAVSDVIFWSSFYSFSSSLFLPSVPVIWWFFGLRWRRHVGDSSSGHSSSSSSCCFSPHPLKQHWLFHHHCHHRHHHQHDYNTLPCTSPIQPVSEDQLTMKVAAVTDGPWDSWRGAFAIRCCGYVQCGRAQCRERDGDRKHTQVEEEHEEGWRGLWCRSVAADKEAPHPTKE